MIYREVLVKFMGIHGHKVEEEHNISSTNWRLDISSEQKILHVLWGYCGKHPKLWYDHFHYIQHAYNRAKNSSTQVSPFEVCLGYFPKSPLDFIFGKDIVVDGHSDVDKAKNSIQQI